MKNKYAITSQLMMKDTTLYFDYFGFDDAMEKYQFEVPIGIIAKYAQKCYGSKYYIHHLEKLLNKEILISHPNVRETVVKYILREKERCELLYDFQKELDV